MNMNINISEEKPISFHFEVKDDVITTIILTKEGSYEITMTREQMNSFLNSVRKWWYYQ